MTLLPCLLVLASTAEAGRAWAVVSPVQVIDGPSSDIVDFGGVAMSEDGTGGLVYRRLVDGRPHIFAAQFADGGWRAPQRVDAGQRFDSSWPAIAAGDGGRLVVAWAQEAGAADRLFGATVQPGSRRFGTPVPIDLNVGDPIALHPSLAMSRGGAAYLTYVVASEDPNLPPGTVHGELRLARFGGQLWSTFGFPLNRNPGAPVRRPTATTAPRVALDAGGNGALVFTEPDNDLIDRVWARRLFGATAGVPLRVSPDRVGERPLRGGADGFDADVSGFGQLTVAFRQTTVPGDPLTGTRTMVAQLPESFTEGAGKVTEAALIDGVPAGETPARPEAPRVAGLPGGQFLSVFGIGPSTFAVAAKEQGLQKPVRIDAEASTVTSTPFVDASESSAEVVAFRRLAQNRGTVVVREVRSDGVDETKTLFAPRGGAVESLDLAGSGLGDAAVGWQQGSRALTQIVAATVDAPPGEFAVNTPADFIRPRVLNLAWDPPANAIGGLRYTLTVDDDTVAEDITRTKVGLTAKQLPEGISVVSVIARDAAGQETSSSPAELKVDGRAPVARIRAASSRRARVTIADGEQGSGVDPASAQIAWGDGRRSSGSAAASHRYRRPGRYRVSVTARDAAGNVRTTRRPVTVR